jgi:transcriptional regulator with XRE-family HTH domain
MANSSTNRLLLRGDVVRRRIAEENLTVAEVAEEIGVARVTVSRWLAGRTTPTARARRRLMASPIFEALSFHDLFKQVQETAA